MKTPTDKEILENIYNNYYEIFASFERDKSTRLSKNFVPIDVNQIGKDLGVDGDIIFGRLYYHLDKKHSVKSDNELKVPFFQLTLEKNGEVDIFSIHFPLLAAVLAEMRDEKKKSNITTLLAVAAIIISILTAIIT